MSEEKICKSCDKELESDYKVCPYCGTNENIVTLSDKNGVICFVLLLATIYVGVFTYRFYINKIKSGIILSIVSIVGILGIIFSTISFISKLTEYNTIYFINNDFSGILMAGLCVILFMVCLIFSYTVWTIDLIKLLKGKLEDAEGKCIKINSKNYIKNLEGK